MKKTILLLSILCMLFNSCSKEENSKVYEEIDLISDVNTNKLNIYKGVFTTNDSEMRGTLTVFLPTPSSKLTSPRAIISLMNGQTITIEGTLLASKDLNKIVAQFENEQLSFLFTSENNSTNPIISNVIFQDKASSILMAKHTVEGPVSTVTGTYECGTCNGHPVLGTGVIQSFNFVFTDMAGEITIATQTAVAGTVYNGIGVQTTICEADGNYTACIIESGDGSTTNVGYTSNGNPVTWNGYINYNNEAPGLNNCSAVNGNWSWPSISYGIIDGSFISDSPCGEAGTETIIALQDFENPIQEWDYSSNVTFFDNGIDGYFGESSFLGPGIGVNRIDFRDIDNNFLFVRDLDDEGNNGGPSAQLTFGSIPVSGYTGINMSFAYDLEAFDIEDGFSYTAILDGVTQPTVFVGFSNSLNQQDIITITVPDGTTTVSLLLEIFQNGENDFAGFDIFKVTGTPNI